MFNLPPWLENLIDELKLIPETVEFDIVKVPNPAQTLTGLQDLKIEIRGSYDPEKEDESQTQSGD